MRKRLRLQTIAGLTTLVALAAALTMVLAGGAGAIVSGAGFTTIGPAPFDQCFSGPGLVNCNIYQDKDDVWINGGPNRAGSAGLTGNATYFFVVLQPGAGSFDPNDGSSDVLSTDTWDKRTFTTDATGEISSYTGVTHLTAGAAPNLLIQLSPYADTLNHGSEYKMALCRIDQLATPYDPASNPITAADCKQDNFKVKNPSVPCTGVCTPLLFGVVSGEKYYDANADGQLDNGELGIADWPIDFTDGTTPNTQPTNGNGVFSLNLEPGSYTFHEELPNTPTTWMQTGNTADQTNSSTGAAGESAILNSNKSYSVTVVDGGRTTGLNFGNLCVGAGGGLTLGFYSNKNGQATVTSGDLYLLTGLYLVDAKGNPFNPTTAKSLASWLLNATATNMAYMLSAQLATMELNVRHNIVSASALIYAPGTSSANDNGFATVQAVMDEGNALLGSTGGNMTVAASDLRTHEEAVKTALDRGNNNLNFVQASASSCPHAAFPGI